MKCGGRTRLGRSADRDRTPCTRLPLAHLRRRVRAGWHRATARPRRDRRSSARATPARWAASCARRLRERDPLRVGRRRRHLARRSRPARDPRRRVGAARRRARPARPRAQRLRRRRLRRAADRRRGRDARARARHRGGLRARDVRRRARPTASGPRSAASTSCATSTGTWMVLEDNVRTPERHRLLDRGARGDARAARSPTTAPHPIEAAATALRNVLGPGNAIVLTDGQDNSAYWEHAFLAERMDVPLAVPADLEVRDGPPPPRRHARRRVYRRTNDDEVDSTVGALLQPVVAAGGVKLVNCLGTGVADDKLAHAYVHDMIRFYLDETPLLDQVETFDLGVPATLERALDVFDELVIKDRGSYGGHRRLHRAARRARGRRGAAGEGHRRAGGLRRPAPGRPLHPPDRDRRSACSPPRRPATVRVDDGPRRRLRPARRA